ncbi:O-Antigen ligase [Marinomonas gallaica]|uniref:O-Antigen ligase n=2 Tax=Marinomonas gallaica TaxID=1806667 RepID=A0A1C3JML0_9GAMM|nr:O-Antigen ligase [Marinomonas gallaica]SBT21501.1 O-Antigen ligase [Marinomonas gallaica]
MERLEPRLQPSVLNNAGIILCTLFVMGNIHFNAISHIVELLIVLVGFWCIYRYGKGMPLTFLLSLFGISILIPLVSWYFAYQAEPEWVKDAPQLEKLARLFIFLPLAWFLKERANYVFYFWGLSALMILLSPWLSGTGWHEIQLIWQGERIDYNLRNAQHTALLFGIVFIGLIAFLPRIYRLNKMYLIPWLLAVILCIITLVGAQTRTSWLALLATTFCCLLYLAFFLKSSKIRLQRRWVFTTIAALILISIPLKQTLGPIVEARLSSEDQVISQLAHFDFNDIPYTSIGTRINTWKAAFEHIAERPLTGWGGQGQEIAIDRSEWLPAWIKSHFGHMHNNYIALLLQYGLMGIIFYFALFGWVFIKILKAVNNNQLPLDIGVFSVAIFSFWSIMGITESYLFFWTGVICIQTIFAGLIALLWHKQTLNIEERGVL